MVRPVDKRRWQLVLMTAGIASTALGGLSLNANEAIGGVVMLAIAVTASKRLHGRKAALRRELDRLRRVTRQAFKARGLDVDDQTVDAYIKAGILYRKESGEATESDDALLELLT